MLFICNFYKTALFFMLGIFWLLAITALSMAQDPWTPKTNMPTAKCAFCTAVVDGKIYAIGGLRTETVSLSTVEMYDPASDTWTEKTPLPAARGRMGGAVVGGKIYVIGGSETGGYPPLSTVEVYDPASDTWTEKAPMPTARVALGCAEVEGKIYAIGGTDLTGSPFRGLNKNEEYDPATDTWTEKAPMPTARFGFPTSVVDGKIYAIGGDVYPEDPWYTSKVEVYDPATDAWTEDKAPMPTARYSHSMNVVKEKIYALGGWRSSVSGPLFTTVEEYDPVKDTWTARTDMPSRTAILSTSVVNEMLYTMGGTRTVHPFSVVNTVYAYDPASDPPVYVEDLSSEQSLTEFELHQNYPNPFNPSTTIRYTLPKTVQVVLKVYNTLGQEVRTLVNVRQIAGEYTVHWDGSAAANKAVSSGIYIYQLHAGKYVQSRKMLLIR